MCMTIAKTLYKFIDFVSEYGDLPLEDESTIETALFTFFGKKIKSFNRKMEVIVKLNFVEVLDASKTIGESFQLTEKGAEYLRKNEVSWLKFGFSALGTVIGAAAVAIFEIVKGFFK